MPDEQLTIILRLRDEATKHMKSARAGIIAAGGAIAAAGFTAGKKWDEATKTIVAGTGATGDALKVLQSDYQAVAKYGDGAATVIADLNTHLGLQGAELQLVAEAALKAGVNTNQFGDTASQLGLNAQETVFFLDQMVTASQESGLSVDQLTMAIGKNSARFQAAGGSVKDLTTLVVENALEFGPTGLRGAMSEIMEEVDKGLIPTVGELSDAIGDSTDRVEQNYQAGKTWRDTLSEMKGAALGYIGPAGDMLGVLGSTVTTLALAGPQMVKFASKVTVAAGAMRKFGKAALVAGVAFASWKVGEWIGETTGLTDAVERGWLRLMGFSKEAARAAQEGRKLGISMADARTAADQMADATSDVEAAIRAANSAFDAAFPETNKYNAEQARLAKLTRLAEQSTAGLTDAIEALAPTLVDSISELDAYGKKLTESGEKMATGFLDGMSDTFAQAFAGGGGFLGGLQAVMTQGWGKLFPAEGETAATGFLGRMQSVMGQLGGVPLVGPLLEAFGPALIAGIGTLTDKVWPAIRKLFGGPDEAELAARETFAGFHKGVVAELGGTQRFAAEVQRAIDDGWDRTLAESRAGFILWGTDAGLRPTTKRLPITGDMSGRCARAIPDSCGRSTQTMRAIEPKRPSFKGARQAARCLPVVRTWSEKRGRRCSCLASLGRWCRTRAFPPLRRSARQWRRRCGRLRLSSLKIRSRMRFTATGPGVPRCTDTDSRIMSR